MEHNEPPPPYQLEEDADSKAAAAVSAVLTAQGIPLAALSQTPRHSMDGVGDDVRAGAHAAVAAVQPRTEPRPTTSSSASSGYRSSDPMSSTSSDGSRTCKRSTGVRKSTVDPSYDPGCCFSETGGANEEGNKRATAKVGVDNHRKRDAL
ncbi:hypothetical protein SPBR_05236 [Sporothrix brasiliensis 5110]|uniref:Uncharacterized protein n=1 Tax=Sporothrix brasiliensis 5110 TaxID=1398154 RepID=A0A0C2EN63_9PEZI|nr:uncharacterized protein SPBR_05236 [Sporothrix brasiliensis 5110]KIH87574.1 hypothetical protein SPBR_05236 [Sporothrix brasiliensis 5110]